MLSANFRTGIARCIGQTALKASVVRYMSSLLNGHVVVALGGNALLKRGEKMTMENQRKNIADGVKTLAKVVNENPTTIVHGNGPQVGLLLLESAAYEKQTGLEQMKLDVLDAETEGMIGYLLEQEFQKYLTKDRGMVTILSEIVCDANDPAFQNPTKFVGPIYTKEEADKLGLPVKADGNHFRRVVASPLPVKMVDHQLQAVRYLTEKNCVVICAGGGGIPVLEDPVTHHYEGVEAVIDKDRAAAMMGLSLGAKGLLILTDVPSVAINFGKPDQQQIKKVSTSALEMLANHFPDGSMGPKVASAVDFCRRAGAGAWSAIGSLNEADRIMNGQAGTLIIDHEDPDYVEFYEKEIEA